MDKHVDIIFLEKRLQELVEKEEYEKAATIKKWIDELTVFFDDKNKSND